MGGLQVAAQAIKLDDAQACIRYWPQFTQTPGRSRVQARLAGDEGSNVSAGEKQLLTVARAFLATPSGQIVERGTHAQLLVAGGAFPAQFTAPVAEDQGLGKRPAVPGTRPRQRLEADAGDGNRLGIR